MDDREIIALFEARSEQAIEELSKKHGRYVSLVAFNILHEARDAEEAINDTYTNMRLKQDIPCGIFSAMLRCRP